MRLRRAAGLAAIIVAIAAVLPGAALATSQSVVIQNFAFMPQTATINAGESITWLNLDAFAHTATSDTGAFDTGPIGTNGNKTVSFAAAGSYPYHCSIHPTMKGTITVQGPVPTTVPPTPTPTPRPTVPPTTVPPTTVPPTATTGPSVSASPAPSGGPTAVPSPTPTRIVVPPGVPTASPSRSPNAGPDLGSGPGPAIATVAFVLALALAGLAFSLYRRK